MGIRWIIKAQADLKREEVMKKRKEGMEDNGEQNAVTLISAFCSKVNTLRDKNFWRDLSRCRFAGIHYLANRAAFWRSNSTSWIDLESISFKYWNRAAISGAVFRSGKVFKSQLSNDKRKVLAM